MNTLDIACLIIAAVSVLVAIGVTALNIRKVKHTIKTLTTMLDTAINGNFTESTFDESTLSALETKLARYLSESAVSSKNLLAEKDKIKTLISDISHQTKTPIANILLYAQLLGEHDLPENCTVCVNALSAQAQKLNFLIGAMVKTSRLETGIITVLPKQESVQKLLDTVIEQLKPKVDSKNITLLSKSTPDTACFDLKWTVEAVYNVLDNAVKYTPEGGHIEIKTVSYELFCRIDITDDGIGMKEKEHSKIFTRFYRSPLVSEQNGVGIGLFLTREILSMQGGYIKVQSEPGKGSTFSVFLPIGK